MAIIPQGQLFTWHEIDEMGDLERLRLVLEYLPDEGLMRELEKERANGRDAYPVRAVWNSIIAGIVFQHPSIESLRRELKRNGQLREVCGFRHLSINDGVPPAWVYTRFLAKLIKAPERIEALFTSLVEALCRELPDFCENLAIDGKAIASLASTKNENQEKDGRRDLDADYGKKVYRGKHKDGTPWEKVVSWFGYRLHIVVDAKYELPVGYAVTKASNSEVKEAHLLIDRMAQNTPVVLERAKYLTGDKGYDDTKLISKLWDEYSIKPVIDIRDMWKDGETTKLISGQTNVIYDYQGTVYCCCPETGKQREMAYGGFEKDRNTLKYRCPARQYGIDCKGQSCCPVASGVRISLDEDRRVFTPLARSSYSWDNIYKTRTAVERVNSRIDEVYGFEKHFIRGLSKMRVRCGLAMVVMLTMALGKVKEKHGNIRSLVEAA
jgi:hypothetical protein